MCDDAAALLYARQQLRLGEGVWTNGPVLRGVAQSTFSAANGCVEVAALDDRVAVRNSREPEGSVLLFSRHEWAAFVGGVRAGEFDLEPELSNVAPGRC
jgi:Domain of unknown function (DUF397)